MGLRVLKENEHRQSGLPQGGLVGPLPLSFISLFMASAASLTWQRAPAPDKIFRRMPSHATVAATEALPASHSHAFDEVRMSAELCVHPRS